MTQEMKRLSKLKERELKLATEPLRLYRAQPQADEFHRCGSLEQIVRGGKRAGKTAAVVAENVSRMLGIPLHDFDGNPYPIRFRVPAPDNPLLFWIIGLDLKHIGQTIHKYLFQPGMGGTFRCIFDEKLDDWRIYNSANPEDKARFKESRLCEPWIPERYIKPDSWVWNNAGANEFESVELINGAKIMAYPSSAPRPKQGDAVYGIWIDEDIAYYNHLQEWQDRLIDLNGWFLWSVWPQSKNMALEELLDRAEEQSEDPDAQIKSFQFLMTNNPFIPEEGKKAALNRMGTEDEIARRNAGDLGLDSLMMYDYASAVHAIRRTTETAEHRATTAWEYLQAIYNREGMFPFEWTRYLVIDPSYTRSACLSFVVPPPTINEIQIGNVAICEWEFVGRKCKPNDLAKGLRVKCSGAYYEAFIMDQNVGRQTRVGHDMTVFQAYATEFEKEGLRSRQTESNFIPGCNKPDHRQRIVRKLMDSSETMPRLLFVEEKVVETIREFRSYRKKQVEHHGEVTVLDEPRNPRKHDCMASLEYFAAFIDPLFTSNTAYVPSSMFGPRGSGAYHAAQRMLKGEGLFGTKAGLEPYVHLGPGALATPG